MSSVGFIEKMKREINVLKNVCWYLVLNFHVNSYFNAKKLIIQGIIKSK